MKRLVFVDHNVQEGLMEIARNRKFIVGLLIGQITEDKDYVIHYIPTPSEDGGESDDDEKKTLSEINEYWITQHAKQVTRLLPGGLDVLGLFVVAPNPKYETRLRQVLFLLSKLLSKYDAIYGPTESASRVAVEICSTTKKVTCHTYNVNDYKSSTEIGDWKVVSDKAQLPWTKLEAKLTMDLSIPISKDKTESSMLRQVQGGLTNYFAKIRRSTVVLDGRIQDQSQTLFPEKKNKKDIVNIPKTLQADLLFESVDPKRQLDVEAGAVMHFKGSIQIRAFVQQKVTVGYAQSAVKKDVIRSLLSRCEIHCEDCLVTDEEESDFQGLHELPRRLFAPVTGTDVSLSDYVLMGEKPIDSMEVFNDILGLTPIEEDIEDNCEIPPESCDQSLSGCSSEEDLRNEETVENLKVNVIVPMMSGAVAAIAVGVYFYISNQ